MKKEKKKKRKKKKNIERKPQQRKFYREKPRGQTVDNITRQNVVWALASAAMAQRWTAAVSELRAAHFVQLRRSKTENGIGMTRGRRRKINNENMNEDIAVLIGLGREKGGREDENGHGGENDLRKR